MWTFSGARVGKRLRAGQSLLLLIAILCFHHIATDESGAMQWCKMYRNPKLKSLKTALDGVHLLEHLNENFNASVMSSDIANLTALESMAFDNGTEAAYMEFCQKIYLKVEDFMNDPNWISLAGDKSGHTIFDVKLRVWVASLISIFIISAVGLLGVGVVPLVQKVFFNQVTQYLVALAVGTLTGDAMLHLLPHAITAGAGHSHDDPSSGEAASSERDAVFKGLVALAGIFFFFMAEKILSLCSEHRAEKKLEQEDRERALTSARKSTEVRRLSSVRPSITPSALNVPGQGAVRRLSQMDPSMCRRASRAVSLAHEDILTTGLSSKAMRSIDVLYRYAEEDEAAEEEMARAMNEVEKRRKAGEEVDGGQLQLTVPSKIGAGTQQKTESSDGEIVLDSITIKVPSLNVDKSEKGMPQQPSPTPKVTVITEDDEYDAETSKKPSHGHGHGHSHEVPGSVAAVAWMVIMGDGLHNFTDGMAIGAAFAQSISGGLSTSVAVFCHELPHELGDFAVLLKTGMRIKEALFFNVVSSVLCLVGMLIGIALGNVESASYWIFAVTAGTFIYIALVDMLPELSSAELRPGQTRIGQIFIQTFGLMTGVGIMMCIAFFEDKIRVVVD